VAVGGGAADFDGGGDGGEGVFVAVVELASDGELVGGHGSGTAADLASGASGFQAGHRALADRSGLKLGQGAEDCVNVG